MPATSDGRSLRRSPQAPVRTQRSDFLVSRAAASSMYIACSATDTELAMPVVISGILRLLSAGISTASKPTPRRATTIMLRRGGELGLAERRAAQGHGMGVLELGVQRRNRIVGQDLEVDVVARLEHVEAGLRHAADDQHLLAILAAVGLVVIVSPAFLERIPAILEPGSAGR